MNAVQEAGLIAGREVRKNVRSAKGLVLVLLALLAAVGATLLFAEVYSLSDGKVSADQIRVAQEAALTQLYHDPGMGTFLSHAPLSLLMVTLFTVWLAPLLIAILGFDAVSAELQFKTVRYWTVRTRRTSYIAGKFLGQWAIVSGVILVMHLLIWIVAIVRGAATPADMAQWGPRFYLITVPMAAAWTGVALLVGSLFRTPILALLTTFVAFFALWLINLIGRASHAPWLTYVYPSSYDAFLLSNRVDRVIIGLAVCLGIGALATAASAVMFERRDV